ncbi:methionine ABC transporter ATP-binding protein [Nocardioides nitrophenolicus]|uniref:methionine ABC transporter ATP-binding protein n=1 Tax=Nocardioides nitrophenolicus TaxID=60489 RepID=UPI00195CE90C|nr:ATP-binding cassette domain-containing protein [Nocardioides nitrophenolicus]MBM7519907.1 ABC-type methionine transport system ATPase subunit [Nocardioides nitrophenolicus]
MIEISGLTKSYGSTTVLDGIDLHVPDGRIAAVVGPSGAGKSTLARCVNALERPTSGSVTVRGLDLAALSGKELRRARQQIGTVFQSASLLRRLTAAQNVALPLRHQGIAEPEVRRRVTELLERVDMLHRANHYPSQLSGGQRQRIGIARGLALRPSVLLSDEATSGLDPDSTRAILALLTELRDDLGVTILVITHEMDVVRGIADHVAQLDHGRIVEQGPVSEVVRRSDSALARALLPLPPALSAPGLRTWRLRLAGEVAPTWLARASRELGVDVAVLAALVEEAGEVSVGRLVVGLPPHLDADVVVAAFRRLGVVAEPDADTDAQPETLADREPAA